MIRGHWNHSHLSFQGEPWEFQELIDAARDGSESVIARLVERYEPHIRAAVRRGMCSAIRKRFDADDFVQMVWLAFFHKRLQETVFTCDRQLRSYLVKMGCNLVNGEHRRHFDSQKYDVCREEPLYDQHGSQLTNPSHIVMLRDQLDDVLSKRSARQRRVIQLRCDGLTHSQIASRLRLHERTSRRIVDDFRAEIES